MKYVKSGNSYDVVEARALVLFPLPSEYGDDLPVVNI
jgi:hypothetical protein